MVGDCHYLNSGDWVESLTAIVEPESGKFELVDYEPFMAEIKTNKEKGDNVVNFAAA